MELQTKILIFVVLFPVFLFLFHIPLSRACRRVQPQALTILMLVLSLPLLLLFLSFALAGSGESLPRALSAAVYFAAACLGCEIVYFHLFNMGETARRVRILGEILRRGSMTEEEIGSAYSGEDIVSLRLDRLVGTGQLSLEHGRYRLRRKSLYLCALGLRLWAELLGLRRKKP